MPNNIPELKNKIISFIQRNGPSIPVHISKQINENMIFTGAVLSELASNKKLLISSAKIGGSPVYYLSGQEYKLSQVLYPYLKDVYKRVHDLLKQKIILRDRELEPWQRVALRESKDFAIMLSLADGEIFWKWYLTSDNEAEILIKKDLGLIVEEKKEIPKEEIREKPLDSFLKKVEEAVEKITGMKPEVLTEQIKPNVRHVKVKHEIEKPKEIEIKEKQQLLKQLDLGALTEFLNQKNISISEQKLIDKKEITLIGEVSSDIGLMKIFVKFKDKKKISDSDLITAHHEAGKLPLYFISSGDLSKKAENYIINNFLIFEKLK